MGFLNSRGFEGRLGRGRDGVGDATVVDFEERGGDAFERGR